MSRVAVSVIVASFALAGFATPAASAPVSAYERVLGPGPVAADRPLPAHARRLVVKYRAAVSECAHCLLARGRRFESVTGSDSLDRLVGRYGVRRARALFFDDHSSGHLRSQASARRFDDLRSRFAERSARAPRGAVDPDLSNVFVLELARGADVYEAAAAFAADPNVAYAEPDYTMSAALVPNDPLWATSGNIWPGEPDLWGLHKIRADVAWDRSIGAGAVVAVIDTGVQQKHVDIAANLWSNPGEIPRNRQDDDGNGFADDVIGYDFTRSHGQPKDKHGHGTHVAGTVAATGDNGLGVIGLAWGAQVMVVQGLNNRGYGSSSDLAKAIVYATENGADVLNNSWGGSSSSAIRDAIAAATSAGAAVVFAAGNENSPYLGVAADPNVIAVAATTIDDERAPFSNYGSNVSVSAPGELVLSLRGPGKLRGPVVDKRYRALSGTSMAAPHVSALAALLLSDDPALGLDELRWHLELGAVQPKADPAEPPTWNAYFGYGRIDAARAFDDVPVTTRLRTPSLSLHGIAGSRPAAIASMDFGFTSLAPVAWTLSTPDFLVAEAASGEGDASVALDLDLEGLAPGTLAGTIALSVPAAIDGGDAADSEVVVHEDVRSGAPIVVADPIRPWGSVRPAVAGDGAGALAAWVEFVPSSPIQIRGAYVEDSGAVVGPFLLADGECDFFCTKKDPNDVAMAFGGDDFLLVWSESLEAFVNDVSLKTRNTTRVLAKRVSASGEELSAPVELWRDVENENRIGGFDRFVGDVGVAFDGEAYTVVWRVLDFDSARLPLEMFLARVAPGGAVLSSAKSIYPIDGVEYHLPSPRLACRSGVCLLAWVQGDGETNAYGKYIHKVFGQRYGGADALDAVPVRLTTDMNWLSDVVAGDSEFLLAGWRYNRPSANVSGNDVVFARVALDGTALDPDTVRVNNSVAEGLPYSVIPSAAAFDGEDYIVTWEELGPSAPLTHCYPMAAKVAPDGTVANPEPEGYLLAERPQKGCPRPRLVATATKSLSLWIPTDLSPATQVLAQGMMPR